MNSIRKPSLLNLVAGVVVIILGILLIDSAYRQFFGVNYGVVLYMSFILFAGFIGGYEIGKYAESKYNEQRKKLIS
ncbi:MAG: hypothetical protein ABSD92_09405 [Candidatus Bathyarchaeia archaeon]|jgi:hypothetical protein